MKRIVLLRHGESLWNKENRFTGWTDVDLSDKGIAEACKAGDMLKYNPVRMVELAVKGMVPHNRLGNQIITKLHVYAGPEHPHAAQKPEELKIDIR